MLLGTLSTQNDREVEDFEVVITLDDEVDGGLMVRVELDDETLLWTEDESLEEALKDLLEEV